MNPQMPHQGQTSMFYDPYEDLYSNMGCQEQINIYEEEGPEEEEVEAEEDQGDPMEVYVGTKTRDPMEIAKRKRHLEMNRLAAARCRENKKRRAETLRVKEQAYKDERLVLRDEILTLRERLMDMKTLLIANKDCELYRLRGGLSERHIATLLDNFQYVPVNLEEEEEIRRLRTVLFGEPSKSGKPADQTKTSEGKAE